MSLGKSIAKHRQALGWSQNELARRAGLNYQTVQRIESGHSKDPGISYVVRIAKAIGVSLETLVGESIVSVRQVQDPTSAITALERRVEAIEKRLSRTKRGK